MNIIDKIISNFINNKSLYIGEKVTISEHMIQTAMIAENAKSSNNLICACLLHDYGHFILEDPDKLVRKKILFVNWTYTKKIIGLDKKESDEILNKIFEHQARLELTCRFTWTENTVCIWDNRSVIHFAIADFYPGRGLGHERIMDRIAIEGDQPH